MLTHVARSRVHCLVTTRDESVSRILFSLSLSPYGSFCTHFFSFPKLQINIYFYWRNVCGRYDLAPKLKYAREHGQGILCQSLLKVHGPLGKSSKFFPPVCHGGCFWPCCSSPHAFWRNIGSRIPCQILAGDSVLCWQEPGAKGQITISFNLPVYPPDVFSLHWSEAQNWKPCCLVACETQRRLPPPWPGEISPFLPFQPANAQTLILSLHSTRNTLFPEHNVLLKNERKHPMVKLLFIPVEFQLQGNTKTCVAWRTDRRQERRVDPK